MSHTSQAGATSQPAVTTVPLPYQGKLTVDRNLILSHKNFKQSVKKYHANKKLSPIDQLKATAPYPTPHVLAQFAFKAYADNLHADSEPPAGWKLLTTASNKGDENGYFGTAYWHPEHQQVVIAHRGTDIENSGALATDVKGVLFNNYVQQISSASTFANKVVAVLQEIEQEMKVSFELFFTGHSLGGWLAQITNFTTKYLEVIRGKFLMKQKRKQEEPPASSTGQAKVFQHIKKSEAEKEGPPARSPVQDSHEVTRSYHPHTVVFDSPGCKDMLLQMQGTFDLRSQERSIDLQHLDITSYLSAPNLINTCNTHLGIVYRIFPDLSGMSFLEKHTPLYNLATHRIDKIVQAFDPETGQVRKDDTGEMKVQEVVDWPVSAGLKYGKELDDFFIWAKHCNDYHPEVIYVSHSKVPEGYNPIRYQTKAYDERTNSLSVFTRDERELLASYRSLRELQTELKLTDCFSVLRDPEAEKRAEQNLLKYELDNKSMRCRNARILQKVIPYVRRLVRLFPDVKAKIKDKLSPPHIINMVYHYETRRNIEKICQSALDFQTGAVGLTEFLKSDQHMWQLRMVDGDVWTGITRVYRALQKSSCTFKNLSEDNCTVLTLEWLLTVNGMINLNKLLASKETRHLLMIACGTNRTVDDELQNMFQELFNSLKEKKNVKIILTTLSKDDIAIFIEEIATETLGEGFIATDGQLTWSDLTAISLRKMLKKTVIFQGRPVPLGHLTVDESMTDSFPFAALLREKELRIGKDPVPSACSGYSEKCYIDRTFNHIVIRQDIFNDERDRKFADLLTTTEQEFKQRCQQNPTSNVHWLEKDHSGELIWQQSRGNLETLRKYVDNQKSQTYAPRDIDKLLQQAKKQRVMLIADKAGMGKTTVLTHLSTRIKQKDPAYWLVRIDLNDYTELLKAHEGKKTDKVWVLEFVSKDVLKLESDLEKELFKKSFEGNETKKVVVMVDGVDEISPDYKQTVLDMLQVLKQTSIEQLWVTTRPYLRQDLEDNLQQLSYTLQPFSEVDQIRFLMKFWLQHSNLEDTNQHRLQIFAESLIRNLAQSISDRDREFTGIPLQTRMLAEIFEEVCTSFYELDKTQPDLPQKLGLLGLYRRFIDIKCDIYYAQKSKIPASNVAGGEQRKRYFKFIQLEHQLLALDALFTEDQLKSLQIYFQPTFLDEELARIGIAQRNNEGKLQFIHRTFAEYFVAQFLIKQLTEESKQHKQVQDILLNEVLLKKDFQVIRAFLDGLLENSKPSGEALKEVGKKNDEQWKETENQGTLEGVTTALHEAAKEDRVHIIGFLRNSLKSGENLSTAKKMLLHKDRWEQTAWHKAAENDSVLSLKYIWGWAEAAYTSQVGAERGHLEASDTIRASIEGEELRPNQIKKELFATKDQYGNTAWHGTAQRGSLKALETLWSWAREVGLNPHELLLFQNEEGNTAWQVAVQRGHFEVLDKMWAWAREAEINRNDLKNEFLLAKDKSGYTIWNRAAESGSLETLQTLWFLGKEAVLKPEEMFLAQGTDGNTAWKVAAQRGHFELLEKLWEWAKGEQMGDDMLKDKLLLAKDKNGNTAWHRAAERGNLQALESLWRWAEDVELNPYELLLAQNETRLTAWHLAADRDHFEAFEKMWEWANDALKSPNDLKKVLLLIKDQYGYNVWHRAAQRGTLQALETLWGWAKSTAKPRRIVAGPK